MAITKGTWKARETVSSSWRVFSSIESAQVWKGKLESIFRRMGVSGIGRGVLKGVWFLDQTVNPSPESPVENVPPSHRFDDSKSL